MRNIILVFLPWFNANIFTYIVARYFYFLSIFITYYLSQIKSKEAFLRHYNLNMQGTGYQRKSQNQHGKKWAWLKDKNELCNPFRGRRIFSQLYKEEMNQAAEGPNIVFVQRLPVCLDVNGLQVDSGELQWFSNVLTCLSWGPFPRIHSLVCFPLGSATGEISRDFEMHTFLLCLIITSLAWNNSWACKRPPFPP